jgi:hypothetical protein
MCCVRLLILFLYFLLGSWGKKREKKNYIKSARKRKKKKPKNQKKKNESEVQKWNRFHEDMSYDFHMKAVNNSH